MILLSILIPTTPDREESFRHLLAHLTYQIQTNNLDDVVELQWDLDNKEKSIGKKRDDLYQLANGLYSVQWDSDDWMHDDGIKLMIQAILRGNQQASCITYQEHCIINGNIEFSNFSLKYDDWHENPKCPAGFKYARTPFTKTPILTQLCRKVGVADMRYGEDHDFARRVNPLLGSEVHIDEFIYQYIHWSTEHNTRYGIKDGDNAQR